MKKNILWLWRITAVCVIIASMAFFGLLLSDQYARYTLHKINNLISKELTPGSTVSQVKLFLDTHNIERSDDLTNTLQYVEDEGMLPSSSDFEWNPKLDGKREKIKTVLVAIKRKAGFGFLVTADISFHFYFDEFNQLVDYTAEIVCTGP